MNFLLQLVCLIVKGTEACEFFDGQGVDKAFVKELVRSELDGVTQIQPVPIVSSFLLGLPLLFFAFIYRTV